MGGGRHCYPGSEVLINKYDICDKVWHYLRAQNINFQVGLLKNNPMYVRDALVMANYDQKGYLQKIIKDAMVNPFLREEYSGYGDGTEEQYQIAKSDYETFRKKIFHKKQ